MLSAFFVLSSLIVAAYSSPVVIPRSPVSLPIAKKFNFNGTRTIVERDRARVAALRSRADGARNVTRRAVVNEDVDNVAVVYSASIGVGSPATTYELIIDTGSSNTWVGAGTRYVQTSTSTETSNRVSVTYGSGSFSGREYIDQVTITSDLVIKSQSIGVASTSSGFSGFDGILGIGPVDLTEGTLSPATTTLIPTVTDNLYSQGSITNDEIGVYFAPTTQEEVVNGELSWGGSDSSKISGTIGYAPLTTTYPASVYWGIDESITYGTSTTILSSTAGIVDTGTTLVYIASDAFAKYKTATGATLDSSTGLLRITSSQYSSLSSLFFNINGVSYELTPNAQIWPRSLNTDIGGSSSAIYLIVNDLGTNSGEGLDFINGYTFLERYYTIFDTANSRIGFAATSNTDATTN
ncbi:aspartic protease [Guyanagaster necrorhizus]|uniref:Aspartic protease n=1 Tax=Guyanagaster necrorhizus TaxID=856835 RepID=A0A9P7W421_9AGAR|nr:aspartic protease [Guyanagaster necrorhizus MCA 3950]KAG7452252.1 aspartic protease [Guyanagaster necrorhizus MCA 3950]